MFLAEHLLQALVLLLAVGKDIESIAVRSVVVEGLHHKFHVLVEQRLWRRTEIDGGSLGRN